MKNVLRTLVVLAAVGGLSAALVVGLGLYNVSARKGHWPGVSWVLHTTYRNAVELRAPPPADVPDLNDPALVSLGAGHYDSACRLCHGAPGIQQSQTVESLVPKPPPIHEAVEDWEPSHLFWIVANGIKMSGMPHWPSRVRQDDVWPVVAFLASVGTLDAGEYAKLVNRHGENVTPVSEAVDSMVKSNPTSSTAADCVVCHALDGRSFGNTYVPRLDLLNTGYLRETLLAYQRGERFSGIMQHAASRLDDESLNAAAQHYGSIAVKRPAMQRSAGNMSSPPPTGLVARGAAIARGEENAREVPACIACHGPWPERLSDDFPIISGQHEMYLLTQLRLWKAGNRGGTDLSRMMHKVVPELSDEQLRAVAAYYADGPSH